MDNKKAPGRTGTESVNIATPSISHQTLNDALVSIEGTRFFCTAADHQGGAIYGVATTN